MKALAGRFLGALRACIPESVKRRLRPLVRTRARREARRIVAASGKSDARRRYRATPHLAVFVSSVPRVREAKLAYGLRRRGWRVVLLHGAIPNYKIESFFDEAALFRDPDDAIRLALNHSPVAFHVFSPSGDVASSHFVNARPGPTVFDTTDLLEITYLGNTDKIDAVRHAIDLQRHGIEFADAYCARDLQFKLAQRRLGYHRRGRVTFFPEYCWGTARLVDSSDPHADVPRTLRCVQAGNFGIEKKGESDWGYLPIAERFTNAGIALDILPNFTHYARGEVEFRSIFSDYLALAQRSPLFRLLRPVRADELDETLRSYDFGVLLLWAEIAAQRPWSFNAEFIPYCMSARVFDYLDAGLPVIISPSYRLIRAMLSRYGAGIVADASFMEDIAAHLRVQASSAVKARAVSASRGLAVERHIHRLERLYERIAADVGIAAG